MPWETVTLIPGLNVQLTQTLLQAGYHEIENGRFKDALFQKIGGWTRYYDATITGTCRKLHAYQDLNGNDRVTIGGEEYLHDLTGGELLDITPQQTDTSVAENFSTTNGSAIVTIVDAEVGTVSPYSAVTFLTPVAVGGLILHGTYQITAYVSATSYSITAASAATSTVANGGAVPTLTTVSGSATVTVGLTAHGLSANDEFVFSTTETIGGLTITGRYVVQTAPTADTFTITATSAASSSAGPTSINSGEAAFRYHITLGPQAVGNAYGAGTYGDGTYGVGASLDATEGTKITAVDWCLENWGDLLIASPEGGGIYWWGNSYGYSDAQLLSEAPIYNTGMFVSISQQVVISYGSTTAASVGAYHDPLLIRWCATGDFFTWPALYQYRLPSGSKCVGGTATRQINLVWTDIDLWSIDYSGASFGYIPHRIGAACGLIAKHAHAKLSGAIYWMGAANFFRLDTSGVSIVPCPVWDAVYQDLDSSYSHLCHAGANSLFSEVKFFYPSASGGYGYCDKYVCLNTVTGEWSAGSEQRNSWIDVGVLNKPLAMTESGVIYRHEDGYNNVSTPITSSFTTGYFTIGEGEDVAFVDRIYPDFKWGEHGGNDDAQLQITVYTSSYPGEDQKIYGPFTVTKAKKFISKRMRGRHMAFKVESSDASSFWRLGKIRIRAKADGRHG